MIKFLIKFMIELMIKLLIKLMIPSYSITGRLHEGQIHSRKQLAT